jgi:hypothetical protein
LHVGQDQAVEPPDITDEATKVHFAPLPQFRSLHDQDVASIYDNTKINMTLGSRRIFIDYGERKY